MTDINLFNQKIGKFRQTEKVFDQKKNCKTYFIGKCINTGPSIHYEEFVGVSVGIHNHLYITLVIFVSFSRYTHQGLTRSGYSGLTLGVDPG